eukprot:3224562-Rhodomonas_salina.2
MAHILHTWPQSLHKWQRSLHKWHSTRALKWRREADLQRGEGAQSRPTRPHRLVAAYPGQYRTWPSARVGSYRSST